MRIKRKLEKAVDFYCEAKNVQSKICSVKKMSYSNFTVEEVRDKFTLNVRYSGFFPELEPILPSEYLNLALSKGLTYQIKGSEKARSEFIIAPILLELRDLSNSSVSIFSGEEFTVDRELGLSGICDFLISRTADELIIDAPVITLVEAKKGVLSDGWGQCIAEMVAAKKFNETKGRPIEYIYGVVTSGSLWHFFQMAGDLVLIDPVEYPLAPVARLLAILNWMIRTS
jgi:hypothetical protein